MSKLQFFEMRASEMCGLYSSDFTKKDAVKQGGTLVQNILDDGLVSKEEFMANIVRLKAVIDTAESEMRKHLRFEKQIILGVEFTPVNGGNTVNYSEDEVWQNLKQDLDDRTELLKLAQKQEVLDLGGIQVPKVGTTPKKSTINIKF
jgi:hypothetical protein